ncbi:MAG TPA: ABC transporter permease [Vicinamibacterales bacterium]|jgi:predicted permease|nr:ABC transporter permease [Vicinamibacterales bacterium]
MAWIERLRQDLAFAARLMRKAPGFSATAVLTLAIGVGASTAIFSQINAVFWKTLPVDRPQELRSLVWYAQKHPYVLGPNVIAGPSLAGIDTLGSFSYPAYTAMRDGTTSFSQLACWADLGEARPVVMRDVGFGTVHFVSGNYFDTLGARAAIGRTLTPDDDTPATTAAVLSDPFWRRSFGARTDVLQNTIDLNGKAFAIVGVMPRGFFGVDPSTIPDVIVPAGAVQLAASTVNPLQNPVLWQMCRVFGRLRPGVNDEQARSDVEPWLREAAEAAVTVAATMQRRPRETEYDLPRLILLDAGRGLGTLRDAVSTPLLILMAVVVAILLVACANIAGLLIVRGAAREREIATRLALGASRGRLVRQLLTESLLLSATGGVLGVALAYALGRTSAALISRFMPTVYGVNRPLGVIVSPDARVLLFSAAVTMITGVTFGCLPALRSTRVELMSAIRQPLGGRRGRRASRLPADKLLVAVQAALSVLLIIGAGLFLRTISNLREAPLGYDPGGLLYARIEPRTGGVPSAERAAFFERVVRRLETVPGIRSVTATDNPPLGRAATIFLGSAAVRFCMPGMTPEAGRDASAAVAGVAPRYFETLRTPVVNGREFDWLDGEAGNTASSGAPDPSRPRLPAIVNEAFVRRFLAGRDPLDSRFGLNCPSQPSAVQIIGVVADSRNLPRQPSLPRIYVPMGGAINVVTLILRTIGRPESMVPTVRKAMTEVRLNVPTFGEITPIELREQQMHQERLLTSLLMAFGAVALLLSSIGIYGMLAYLVTRRTPEIGIRMALGARPAAVIAMVLRESVAPVGAGLALGAVAAIAAARWVNALLFGVAPYDPRTIAGAASVFLTIATLAALVPALRASRIDPLGALRSE